MAVSVHGDAAGASSPQDDDAARSSTVLAPLCLASSCGRSPCGHFSGRWVHLRCAGNNGTVAFPCSYHFTSFGLRINISLRITSFDSCSLKTVTWIGPSSGMTGLLGCSAETTFLGLSELPKEVLDGASLASNDACNGTLIAQNSKSSRKFRRARAKRSS